MNLEIIIFLNILLLSEQYLLNVNSFCKTINSNFKDISFFTSLRNNKNYIKLNTLYNRNSHNKNINFDDDDEYSDDELSNEFGSEIENMLNKKYVNKLPREIGIRILYPVGNPPEILKKHIIEKSNEKSNKKSNKKSKNFELIFNNDFNFTNIGGYDSIKSELLQCADILVNYTKYEKYNVRVPKGLILEGPPGNGKTILTKAFSGEINVGFIPVSGSQFQEMYVGVGASRVRELFEFAKENKPCIIFIDEIDALGRKRSTEIESSSSERDSTLNELLVGLDGFKNTNGIFVIGATNRIDLLDSALIRAGRIDKKIYIGNPDRKTRNKIISIHLKGKPYNNNVDIEKIVEITNGFSGAEIENLLNEAMLLALRENREKIDKQDIESIANRILTGWQINENKLSHEMITQIAIHEIGHALISIFTKYRKIIKVSINLWSPKALGFTLFDESINNGISTKESLIKEVMVLLGGRVAEEIFYNDKISSGAVDDFHRVKNIIQKMVLEYGMGTTLFLPYNSDKYREKIDNEIENIFNEAYDNTKYLLTNSKQLIKDCANLLIVENEITEDQILQKIKGIYDYLIEK
jgi:cell division protease FtsH